MNYHIEQRTWEYILKFLRGIKGLHTKEESKLRRFVEGIWYIMRSGCQWRLLPEDYGNWRAIHRRFKQWSDKGIWEQLMTYVVDADKENLLMDATIVRAHACAAGYVKSSQDAQALGRSKGGLSTKIHALVDALGLPLKFIVTPGQRNDITQAQSLIKGEKNSTIIADKGYDSDELIEAIKKQGCMAVVPSRIKRKKPRQYDRHLYKERHLIECFFSKIKHFRRVFSRFDKTASVFLSFLSFVGALIWLR